MLPNANGAACPRPVHRRLRPVASTLLAGILLVATGAATPGMAQHRGQHQGKGRKALRKGSTFHDSFPPNEAGPSQ